MRRTAAFIVSSLAAVSIGAIAAWSPQDDDGPMPASMSADLPRTGFAPASAASIDALVESALEAHGIPGASLTVAFNGNVVLSRGYGFANVETGEPMTPESRFLLASVSKSITAVTALKMVDAGTFGLDDAAYALIQPIEPPPGMAANPEVLGITVRQMLHHEGGWDRTKSGDPASWERRVMRALGVRNAPTMFDLARYMLAQPLDFLPGTRAVYSNAGYDITGVVITRQSQAFYADTVRQLVLGPMGLDGIRVDVRAPRYMENEARRYAAGGQHMLPGGHPPMNLAAGGWTARSRDMVEFLVALSGSKTGTPFLSPAMMTEMTRPSPTVPPRENGTYFGLGWDTVEPMHGRFRYAKDGGLPGISTWIEHLPLDPNGPSAQTQNGFHHGDSLDWAIFFNAHVENDEGKVIVGAVTARLRRALEAIDWTP
jgi:CubicO group peptidase (beta-lactamase class C family)